MKIALPKSFYAGLAVYAAVLILAATPVFPSPLSAFAVEKFAMLAVIASLIVLILLVTGLDKQLHDPGASFTQAVFGIAICAGVYAWLSPEPRPSVVDLSMLWIIVGISQLGSRRVVALMGAYMAVYLMACYPLILDTSSRAHGDAIYTLAVSLILGGFLYWRAREYDHLMGEHASTVERLAQAKTESAQALDQLHDMTVQDSDTTALKYNYFVAQVANEKRRVDLERGTFSIGLIEIDGFNELAKRLGETSAKQILREFTQRAEECIRITDEKSAWPKKFHPLGRISGGRFGMLLPGADHAAAMQCARRLHDLRHFRFIRTNAGVVGITLSIGVTEYQACESAEDVMQMAENALKFVMTHSGDSFRGLRLVAKA